MNFRTFKQNKLVRDNTVSFLEKSGSKLYWFTLNDQEYCKQLRLKLIEESLEVQQTKTKEELLEELADVLEVVYALAKSNDILIKDLDAFQKCKRKEKGAYDKRIFVTLAEHQKNSPSELYCLINSEKYPEIK